jgi:hypothetical protein
LLVRRVVNHVVAAANTGVPALLVLEALGFRVEITADGDGAACRAARGDERYVADDPVAVLGLIKLVELRGWDWAASDSELDAATRRYRLG